MSTFGLCALSSLFYSICDNHETCHSLTIYFKKRFNCQTFTLQKMMLLMKWTSSVLSLFFRTSLLPWRQCISLRLSLSGNNLFLKLTGPWSVKFQSKQRVLLKTLPEQYFLCRKHKSCRQNSVAQYWLFSQFSSTTIVEQLCILVYHVLQEVSN